MKYKCDNEQRAKNSTRQTKNLPYKSDKLCREINVKRQPNKSQEQMSRHYEDRRGVLRDILGL